MSRLDIMQPRAGNDGKEDARARIMRDVLPNEGGCWLWQGARSASGYGSLGFRGKAWRAHRLAFSAWVQDPGSLNVLHRCDTPRCVNPEHLFLGTPRDNAKDRAAKGRNNGLARSGGANCNAKLTEELVRFIRDSPLSGGELGRQLGITRHNIGAIRRNETWRHV